MEIIDYYREIQHEASKDAYKATCHYLTLDENENPQPHGSGVFVEIDSEKFLFTAAHVTDDMEDDIYVGIGENEVLKLGGELTRNEAPGNRDDDKIDIAIMKLSDETIEKLGDQYDFIKQDELGINHEFKELPMYQSVGFPATKSKFNKFKNELKSRPFLYTTMPAKSELYEKLGCQTYSNIIVHYDKKNVKDYRTDQTVTGPDPFGISGSGLWHTPSQVKAKGEKIDKLLVGIMTEWPTENRKYWIGTRIDLFTEIVRQKYGLNIPQSKIVKVNI
ncbi:MAG: hypothetical protein HKN51_14770 [Saprospiraceae bacterium]|nr:hypothetical protein [Saprospiraceae bacterium]